MKDYKDINQFIETFKRDFSDNVQEKKLLENHFTHGYCYHFAVIMANLFEGNLIYNPVDNHFAFYTQGKIYDITGEIPKQGGWYVWDYYKDTFDPADAERVIEQCCYKVYLGEK